MLPQPEMNTTPLIDVLLVLLVLLILTVPAVTHQTTLELPHGRDKPDTPVLLDIDFDGRMFWNAEPVEGLVALEQRLSHHATHTPDTPLRIHADARARYEPVVQVLAAAQRAKVSRISVDPIRDE